MKVIELEGIDNVRDLGGIAVSGGRMVTPGLFYRGSSMHRMTESDSQILFNDLNIRCVIDLRCGWEIDAKPNVQVKGVEYAHIPFYDEDIVGIDYSKPVAGTKMIGRDFACDPDDFYRSLSNPLTVSQMKKCIHKVFSLTTEGKALYQHCSGGKDRTGIMTLLVLSVLGSSEEDILQDYLYTNVARDENRDKVYSRFLRLSDGDEVLAEKLTDSHRALPEHLESFYDEISIRYGGMDYFIENQLGIDLDLKNYFRDKCTCRAALPIDAKGNVAPSEDSQDNELLLAV